MINRPDVYTVPGGDTVQMVESARAVRRLGVTVDLATADRMPGFGAYDLLHVFNWEQMEAVLSSDRGLCGGRPPIVLEPIMMFQTAHWYEAASGAKPLWMAVRRLMGDSGGRKLYVAWQERKFRRGPIRAALLRALEAPARIVTNSEAEFEHAHSIFGLRKFAAKLSVIPNGVDRASFDPLPAAETELPGCGRLHKFVIQGARIQRVKNQLELIEALFDVPVPIVFAGQWSPYEPEYLARCMDAGRRRGMVHFIGAVPHERMAGLYRAAAVHVLPSYREVLPLSCLEAAAAGCRIVCTTVGGIREYFGELAWYCDPWDRSSIRRAVMEALHAPESTRLRELVLAKYTWDCIAQQIFEVYGQVLGRSESRAAEGARTYQHAGRG